MVRPLVAFATFFRDGGKVFETAPLQVDQWNPQTRAVPIRLYVAAGLLEPGTYDTQITVLDPSTNRAAYWRGQVVIVK